MDFGDFLRYKAFSIIFVYCLLKIKSLGLIPGIDGHSLILAINFIVCRYTQLFNIIIYYFSFSMYKIETHGWLCTTRIWRTTFKSVTYMTIDLTKHVFLWYHLIILVYTCKLWAVVRFYHIMDHLTKWVRPTWVYKRCIGSTCLLTPSCVMCHGFRWGCKKLLGITEVLLGGTLRSLLLFNA